MKQVIDKSIIPSYTDLFTRLRGLQAGVPLCSYIISLWMEAAWLEESRRWTGMNTYSKA